MNTKKQFRHRRIVTKRKTKKKKSKIRKRIEVIEISLSSSIFINKLREGLWKGRQKSESTTFSPPQEYPRLTANHLSFGLNLLQTIGCEQTWRISVEPSLLVIDVLKTIRQRVDFFLFLVPVWSGNLCSTSTFLSFKIPTQSHLKKIFKT